MLSHEDYELLRHLKQKLPDKMHKTPLALHIAAMFVTEHVHLFPHVGAMFISDTEVIISTNIFQKLLGLKESPRKVLSKNSGFELKKVDKQTRKRISQQIPELCEVLAGQRVSLLHHGCPALFSKSSSLEDIAKIKYVDPKKAKSVQKYTNENFQRNCMKRSKSPESDISPLFQETSEKGENYSLINPSFESGGILFPSLTENFNNSSVDELHIEDNQFNSSPVEQWPNYEFDPLNRETDENVEKYFFDDPYSEGDGMLFPSLTENFNNRSFDDFGVDHLLMYESNYEL